MTKALTWTLRLGYQGESSLECKRDTQSEFQEKAIEEETSQKVQGGVPGRHPRNQDWNGKTRSQRGVFHSFLSQHLCSVVFF